MSVDIRSCPALSVAILAMLMIACEGDSREGLPTSGPGLVGVPVEIESEARVTLGVREGDASQEFDDVMTPFVTPEGLIGVPSAGHGEIRLFDEAGSLASTYGGVGEGPGEFIRMAGAWVRGDTIEAFDVALQRITKFLPTGQAEVTILDGPRVMWGVGPASSGWVLVNLVEPGLRGQGPRDQWTVYWFDHSGQHQDDIAGAPGIWRVALPGSVASAAFSPSARFAVEQDEIYVAETLTSEVRVLDRRGDTRRTIRWEPERRPAPAEALARVRDELEGRSSVEERVEQLLSAPLPDRIPLFTDLLVDSEGFVWVRRYRPERDATIVGGTTAVHRNNAGGDWDVFSQEGEAMGIVSMPAELEPYSIVKDAVVGVARSPLGVEMVRVHSVIRR